MYPYHQHELSPCKAYTEYLIIPRSTVSHTQPVSHRLITHLWADHVVLQSKHSHHYELQINRVSAASMWPFWSTSSWSTTSKHFSNCNRSWPPSGYLNWFHCGLQVYLQTHLFTSSKFPDHDLQVNLPTCSTMAPKCTPEITQSQSPSASSNLLAHGL